MARKGAPRDRARKPPPRCKAILLCERVLSDSFSGMLSLIGIIERLPLTPSGNTAPFTAYAQLTSGIGPYTITVRVEDLGDGQVIAETPGQVVDFPTRQTKVHLVIPFPPLRLAGGLYDFIVLADDQEIDRQQFHAAPAAPEPDDGEDPTAPGQGDDEG